MTDVALVGDIGGTNSRFGLVAPGTTDVRDIEALKNDSFASLEAVVAHYLARRGIASVASLSVAVAGPVSGERIGLTNRNWTFTRGSLGRAAGADRVVLLNDFEALALALPHLTVGDVVQIGGEASPIGVKLVLGPGTGLGMGMLAPLPGGGWMALPGELGHVTLPVVTQAEFDWREAMTLPGIVFESEDAITGPGLLRMYRARCTLRGEAALCNTPERVLRAALERTDAIAVETLDQFIVWLARLAGDAAMAMQARGGVYLAGGIAPSIVELLKGGTFRRIFEDKGRLAQTVRPIPVYVIIDRFPAFKGCAAALNNK